MAELEDKQMTCQDCGDDFVFTVGEQEFYQSKQFADPKRCAPCRRKKREQRDGR